MREAPRTLTLCARYVWLANCYSSPGYTHNPGCKIDAPVAPLPWDSSGPAHPGNQRQADFFCGKLNGITFPYSSGGIQFVAFFLKLLGTKNSMIFAINHPTCNNKTEVKKFLILTNLYKCLRADSPEHIRILSVMDCNFRNFAITLKIPPRGRANRRRKLVKSY
jgi:hypothetical protein